MPAGTDSPANVEVCGPISGDFEVTQSLFGPSEPSRPYILAPSDGVGNDAMRVKNGGCRLRGKAIASPLAIVGLSRSVSEPGLRRIETKSRLANFGKLAIKSDPPSPTLSPQTPRTLRGAVRQASMLPISVRTVRKRITPVITALGDQGNSTPSSPSSSPGGKRVTFAADAESPKGISDYVDSRSAAGERQAALSRSKSLMSSLYDLRRAVPNKNGVHQDITLMDATLLDLKDSESQLREIEARLLNSHEPVAEFGGSRFATTLISQRSLAVVQRKALLLNQADARTKVFEEAHARREDLCDELLERDCPIPDTFVGLRKFIAGLVHKDGNPIDADKSNFELFVSSFGFPPKHQAILKLKEFEVAAVEWWAWRTLREAQCGASSDAIQRMIAVVVALCGEQRHPALAEVETLLGERLAEKVLQTAEKLQARDATTVGLSATPQPASALEAANGIKEEIRKAKAMGAPMKHHLMERAKGIEVALRIEEKNRLAAKVLLAAQAEQEEDAKLAVAAAPSVAPVGPATERAECIEKAIDVAVSRDGVQEAHPSLKEARCISKALRDLDGDRKRLAAREKRLGKL